jgi:hypothetical protein
VNGGASGGASPYAPPMAAGSGRPAVRPPGSALVFLWALFAIALTGPGVLWTPWFKATFDEGDAAPALSLVGLAATLPVLPALLAPVWAYLSDRLPVMGTRREGYLVLGGTLAVAGWAAAPLLPATPSVWLADGALLYLATNMVRVIAHGALAEIGQLRRCTGLLAAGQVGLLPLGGLAAAPLLEVVMPRPIGWTAAVGAAAALSVVLLAMLLPEPAGGAGGAQSPAAVTLPSWLGSRRCWGPMLVAVCAAPTGLRDSTQLLILTASFTDELRWRGHVVEALAVPSAAAVYLLLCRRSPLRLTLPLAIAIEGATLLALLLWQAGAPGFLIAKLATSLGAGFAASARMDLILRAVPRGREATGMVLLAFAAALPRAVLAIPVFMAFGRGPPSPSLVAGTAALVIVSALAVRAVPGELLAGRDGAPARA